jgi:hypothetical protein
MTRPRPQVVTRGVAAALVVALLAACDSSSSVAPSQPAPSAPPSVPITPAPSVAQPTSASTPTASPTPSGPAATPVSAVVASVGHETAVSRIPASVADRAWEPVVATHPTDPSRIAVVYVHSPGPIVRISHDGGRTWRSTKAQPGAGSGRGMGIHAAIAWGPGPRGGTRLYWANMTAGGGGLSLSTTYTDNEGASWAPLRVERRTRPWVGGFPDIAVDRDAKSPNYGTVYVAYNWYPAGAAAPGFRLLASTDFGRTFAAAEVPVATRPHGYPESWRIAYRVRTAANGTLYASWYQVDMRHWDRTNIFAKGGSGNVGRLAMVVARISFDRRTRTFKVGQPRIAATVAENAFTTSSASASGTGGNIRPDPMWQQGIDVEPGTGRLYVAVAGFGAPVNGRPRGTIRVGRSDDGGKAWTFTTLPSLPDVRGRAQSSIKPNLVAGRDYVVVTFQTLDDTGANATIGNAYVVSSDGGRTWGAPRPVSATRWSAARLGGVTNAFGLRERAERLANGDVFWAYGDGRHMGAGSTGRTAVYGTLIHIAR